MTLLCYFITHVVPSHYTIDQKIIHFSKIWVICNQIQNKYWTRAFSYLFYYEYIRKLNLEPPPNNINQQKNCFKPKKNHIWMKFYTIFIFKKRSNYPKLITTVKIKRTETLYNRIPNYNLQELVWIIILLNRNEWKNIEAKSSI